jgi:ribonuclease J
MPEENIIIADNGSIIHVLDPEPTSHLKNGWANGENSGSFVAHPLAAGNTPRIAQYQGASWWFNRKVAPSDTVMVDGLGIGDIGNVVLRDRQVLSEDGMFVIITLVEGKTGKVRGSPDIISRGFVYLKENKELLAQARKKIRFIVERKTTHPINWVDLKDMIRDEIGLFLFQKTERRPMVLPVVIEV